MAYLFAKYGKSTALPLMGVFIFIFSLIPSEGIAAENCSGTAVEISNRIFYASETATCIATTSIGIGPMVTINEKAFICLKAPQITFNPPFQIAHGATLIAGQSGCGPLNDTGINWGGNYPSGNNATCNSNIAAPQDCHQGRDATHNHDSDGHAGFSYTKISDMGKGLPASATSWACVRDNITGLIWEVKTNDGGIHDMNNSYRWGGKTHLGSDYGPYYDDWNTLVDESNTENFCGFSDWRVPNIKELENLANRYQYRYQLDSGPAIDSNYFPNTPTSTFWSASPASQPPASAQTEAWRTGFGAAASYPIPRYSYGHVRLVRGGQ